MTSQLFKRIKCPRFVDGSPCKGYLEFLHEFHQDMGGEMNNSHWEYYKCEACGQMVQRHWHWEDMESTELTSRARQEIIEENKQLESAIEKWCRGDISCVNQLVIEQHPCGKTADYWDRGTYISDELLFFIVIYVALTVVIMIMLGKESRR